MCVHCTAIFILSNKPNSLIWKCLHRNTQTHFNLDLPFVLCLPLGNLSMYLEPLSSYLKWMSFKIKTRRLCVLANTKLYHRNLLLWISMKFWILVSTTLGLFSKDPPIYPNTHTKLTKIKIRSSLGQFKHCSESLI